MYVNLELTKDDEIFQNSRDYFEKNIDFLIEQCVTGAKNISFMAGFSFLEGYLRHRFPKKLGFNKYHREINFSNMTEAFINYLTELKNNSKSFIEKKNIEHSILLLHDLTYTYTQTNSIRHDFLMNTFEPGTYYKLFAQLKDFFMLQGIKEEDYKKFDLILNKRSIVEDQINGGFLQYFSDSNESFFQNYDDFIMFRKEKALLTSTVQDNILEGHASKVVQIMNDYNNEIYNDKLEKFSGNEEYSTKLTYSINQEYIGRDYYKEFSDMIEPNEQQESILKNCLNIINENPNHYVLITGAPGTGKTIVLIRLLIQLMKAKKISQLVTFSESLELYNKHFSNEYNKITKEISDSTMRDFQNHLIKSFNDWVKSPLCVFLKVGELYELSDDELNNYKLGRKYDISFFVNQYKRASTDIWPNLKDVDDDKDMLSFHKILDEFQLRENRLPLDYAYWKFVKKINQEDMAPLIITAKCPDFILIDEVQDLTLAQLETAKKIAKFGAVLAGDLNQCIEQNYTKWEDLGINPSYGTELTHNYRTSYNIQLLSNLFLKESGKQTYKLDDEKKIQGPKPQLYISKEENDYSYRNACKQIACSVDMLLNSCKKEMKDIYIVASSTEELKKIVEELINRELPIKIKVLRKEENGDKKIFSENSIKLGTIESIKGIDCPILIFLITQNLVNSKTEPLIQDSIYSVINRAMHLLEIFMPCHDLKSKAIQDLINLLKSQKLNNEVSLLNNLHQFYPVKKKSIKGDDYIIGRMEDGREGSIRIDLLQKFSPELKDIFDSVFLVTIYSEYRKLFYLTPRERLDIKRGRIISKIKDEQHILLVNDNYNNYTIHKDYCNCYDKLKEGDDVTFDIREFTNAGGNKVNFAVNIKKIVPNGPFMNVPLD